MIASIVLNDMERTQLASYGYRSWILQDIQEPYEVILNLFNDKKTHFENLSVNANPNCVKIIKDFPPSEYFNISAANNIGLHFASGEYIFFANSDVIYPSNYLRILMEELDKRKIFYALGSRVDLNEAQTLSLKQPLEYDLDNNFDFMVGYENIPGRTLGGASSPWIIQREVAATIGGFDPEILCHEDSEFNDRVIHYLKRNNKQQFIYSVACIYGYHLYHKTSELYNVSLHSKSILEPRRLRLLAAPDSNEDITTVDLSSLDSLLNDFYNTKKPENKVKKDSLSRRGFNRVKKALKILLKGDS